VLTAGGASSFRSPFSTPSILYLKQKNWAVQNSASLGFGPLGSISPGEIITIKGTNLGPVTTATATVPSSNILDKTLADTQVLFDDIAGVPLYVSDTQINVIVPYQIADRSSTNVRIVSKGLPSPALNYIVDPAAPGIFTLSATGSGQAAALNEDYSVNGPGNRVARGSIVQIFATGEGVTSPAGVDGLIVSGADQLRRPTAAVTATIGGKAAEVLYAGSAPLSPCGAFQLNLRVPTDSPVGGALPVVITVGDASSQPKVTLAVR
jgi:uncharacterized protein (TIGR03437 family)